MKQLDQAVIDFLRRNGIKGGRAGTGKSKQRPKEHYQRIQKLGVQKRKENK